MSEERAAYMADGLSPRERADYESAEYRTRILLRAAEGTDPQFFQILAAQPAGYLTRAARDRRDARSREGERNRFHQENGAKILRANVLLAACLALLEQVVVAKTYADVPIRAAEMTLAEIQRYSKKPALPETGTSQC